MQLVGLPSGMRLGFKEASTDVFRTSKETVGSRQCSSNRDGGSASAVKAIGDPGRSRKCAECCCLKRLTLSQRSLSLSRSSPSQGPALYEVSVAPQSGFTRTPSTNKRRIIRLWRELLGSEIYGSDTLYAETKYASFEEIIHAIFVAQHTPKRLPTPYALIAFRASSAGSAGNHSTRHFQCLLL